MSRILITGCSSGIGLATAQLLREQGHGVFATVRRSEDVAKLREQNFETFLLDLDSSDSIQQTVKEILQRAGGIDVLFNNGAYAIPGAVEDLSREAMRAIFETNLFGTIELTNAVIPTMRRQGHGKIIQNSSLLGFVAMPYRGAYVATKFALEGISDALRQELKGTGIRVIIVEPGPILTKFRSNSLLAFRHFINPETSVHKAIYEAYLGEKLAKEGAVVPFTLSADAVAKVILKIVNSPHPASRYGVTVPTHVLQVARRMLPTFLLDRLLTRVGR